MQALGETTGLLDTVLHVLELLVQTFLHSVDQSNPGRCERELADSSLLSTCSTTQVASILEDTGYAWIVIGHCYIKDYGIQSIGIVDIRCSQIWHWMLAIITEIALTLIHSIFLYVFKQNIPLATASDDGDGDKSLFSWTKINALLMTSFSLPWCAFSMAKFSEEKLNKSRSMFSCKGARKRAWSDCVLIDWCV